MRDLTGPTQSRAIRDLLQSLFVLEALQPSQTLWLLSAWVTDAPMLDNSARQFAAVDPEWDTGPVTLSRILRTILERSGRIHVITRKHDINRPFVDKLRPLQQEHPGRLLVLVEEDFHDKGLIGQHYELAGSMNFTAKGIQTNAEHVILRTDPATVAERHLVLTQLWKSRLDAAAGP
jgi:hypothetical protein